MNITIKGTHVELTPAMKAYAVEKIAGLEKFFPSILAARIELERTTRHHQKGEVWRAEVNVTIPRRLVRAEAVTKDIYAAIDKVKDEVKRELRTLRDKMSSKNRGRTAKRR